MSFNATTRPRARKTHRCEECGRAIEPGERYERVAAVWEGDFFTNVACRHCAIARMIVDESDPWYHEGYYGGLTEWLWDNGSGAAWSEQLHEAVQARWCGEDGTSLPPPTTSSPRLQERIDERWSS